MAACSSGPQAPQLDAIEPALVSPLVETPALLRGHHFYNRTLVQVDDNRAPTIDSQWGASLGSVTLPPPSVRYRDTETLEIVVPRGLAPGSYDVSIVSPRGLTAVLPRGLTVLGGAGDLGADADAGLPDGATDDAGPLDLAVPDQGAPDLALPDLEIPDLALPDLASSADLALPPGCNNGIRDGNELDIDCGPTCNRLCTGDPCPGILPCQTGNCDNGRCALASGPPGWLSAANLATPRSGLAVARGPDRMIYAMGGNGQAMNQFLNVVELYDEGTDKWSTLMTPMPTARGGLTGAAGADMRVYAFGGFAGGNNYLPTNEAWSPMKMAWGNPATAPMQTVSYDLAAVGANNGLLYVFGGYNQVGKYLNTVQIYTPQNNLWTMGAVMPTARYAHAAALGRDSRVYVLGGYSQAGGYFATVEAYTPGQDAWDMNVAPLRTPRFAPSAALGGDGRVYAMGGAPPMLLGTVEAYSSASNSWATVAPLKVARGFAGAAMAPSGRILLIGGTDGAVSSAVEAYGPRIALDVTTGPPGTMAKLNGNNFAANATVVVLFNNQPTPVGTGASDAQGALLAPIPLTVPAVAPGSYEVIAYDNRSQYRVIARFIVQ